MPLILPQTSRLASLVLAGTVLFAAVGITLPAPAFAQASMEAGKVQRKFTADDIEIADYKNGDLPAGQSAITAKVQILLDRSGISPGVVDGWRGGMSESAIRAFQRRAGLPTDGRMSPVVWQLLQPFAEGALTMEYTITEKDAEGLVDKIPTDYAEKAKMTSQGYTSILEKLSERFHMDEKFLQKLNPGVDFVPGATIRTTIPAKPIRTTVTRIIVDKATRRVAAYDAKGNMVADYPATVGSSTTPSPHGKHKVNAVAINPTYTYNPNKNFKQGNNDRVLLIPPGPNGPVGDVWIDLSQPTYGIHGTATPSRLFVNQSYGCVRLTNWDARELAHMVKPGVTEVEFLDPGVSIADVTGGHPAQSAGTVAAGVATAISARRPPARPQELANTATPAVPPITPPTAASGSSVIATPGVLASQAAAQMVTAPAAPGVNQGANPGTGTPTAPVVAGNDLLSTAISDAVNGEAPVGASPLPVASAPVVISGQPPRRNPLHRPAPPAATAPLPGR